MSILPCGNCGNYWCQGLCWPAQPVQPTVPVVVPSTTVFTWPDRLHPDDIEKIAKRVVELLAEKLK
jgi:hypothetical protein